MRMRRKKHGPERIAACSELLINKGDDIKAAFPNPAFPLCLEIGCGKGGFACGMAAQHHDINIVALERVADVACLALEKAKAAKDDRPTDNLRFMIADAKDLLEIFPEHSIDRIYLNFSDPWPKKGHAKRRLTHVSKLNIYKSLLKDGAELRLKTDNDGLFEFSLEQFEEAGFELLWKTTDLHNSEYNKDNIMTEYERNFSEKGKNINAAVVVKRKDK